jgi:putative spermidine/putrescine transport system ATP-binding protein
MTVAVTLESVSCVFGSGAQSVRAVDRVDLTIEGGEFFTLLGPSGSGKTTCLRMIGGFTLPTSGTIRIGGLDVTHQPPYARPVNTVFQDYALFPHMSIRDNVAYGLMVQRVDKAERHRRAEEMLELVRLPGVGERRPGQLSGGQRQRVAIARALVNRPSILLADEPTGNLDSTTSQEIMRVFEELSRQGQTVVMVTHEPDIAAHARRVVVLRDGVVESDERREKFVDRVGIAHATTKVAHD